jgi:hypothetical protein
VDRQPDQASLVGDRPDDELADPPDGVRGEPGASLPAELPDGAEEAEISLLDQVGQ